MKKILERIEKKRAEWRDHHECCYNFDIKCNGKIEFWISFVSPHLLSPVCQTHFVLIMRDFDKHIKIIEDRIKKDKWSFERVDVRILTEDIRYFIQNLSLTLGKLGTLIRNFPLP